MYRSSWNVRYPMYMALWFYKILTLLPKATSFQSEAHLVRSTETPFCDQHKCDIPAF
jgi:hypothetical protein